MPSDIFKVRHVSDGDTLVLDNGQKVRLLGVDSPELHDDQRNGHNAFKNGLKRKTVDRFAERAKAFLKNEVEGRTVRLEYDWQRQDKYGRTLAYVYRQEDNVFINALLLSEGYVFAYTSFPFKYSERFKLLSAEARKQRKGLWG